MTNSQLRRHLEQHTLLLKNNVIPHHHAILPKHQIVALCERKKIESASFVTCAIYRHSTSLYTSPHSLTRNSKQIGDPDPLHQPHSAPN